MLIRASLLLVLVLGAELALSQPSAFVPETDAYVARYAPEAKKAAQHRYVRVDLAALEAARHIGGTLALDLFDGARVVVEADRVDRRGPGQWSWFGHVEGHPVERVSLTIHGEVVVGRIVAGGAVYMLEHAGGGTHVLYEYVPDPNDETCEPLPTPDAPGAAPPGRASDAGRGTEPIDVLVVYTRDVVAAIGEDGARVHAQAMIDVLNESFVGAGFPSMARLAHAREVDYAASDERTSLDELVRLSDRDDGHLDEVLAWRDELQADVVALLTERGRANCGIAYLMKDISRSAGRNAFTVVRRSCSVSDLVFPHEFGHLMGIRHDRYVDTGTIPTPYAHGFVNTSPAHNPPFRTATAYSTECTDLNISCPRIPAFSTTKAFWAGDALGSEGADGARVMRMSVPIMATFRDPAYALPAHVEVETATDEDTPVRIELPDAVGAEVGDDHVALLTLGEPTTGTVSGTGSVVYRPPANYHGPASFPFTCHDEAGLVGAGSVEVVVSPISDPPTTPYLLDPGSQSVAVPPGAPGAHRVEWRPSSDADGDSVSYRWWLTPYPDPPSETNPILLEIDAGHEAYVDVPLSLLSDLRAAPVPVMASGVGVARHRVVASDGELVTEGPSGILLLSPSGALPPPAEPAPPDQSEISVTVAGPFPSPARGRVAFWLDLPDSAEATLTLYDALGRLAFVRRLPLAPGTAVRAEWGLPGLAAGVYAYRLGIASAEGDATASGRLSVVD